MSTGYVTGATGCVGRNLVEVLLSENWDIVVLHRASSDLTKLTGCKVRFQEVDLSDLQSVRDSIPENCDAIFHVAGNTSHWAADAHQQWIDNVLATRNLLTIALEKNVKRFIFTSTGATLGHQGSDERIANKIKMGYVRTKRLAELEVYQAVEKGLDAIILHPIIVVGAYDYNSYAQLFTTLKASPIKFAFPGKIAFCHAKDVAKAHLQAYEKGRNGEHYVLGGTHTTWLEMFQKIALAVGAEGRVFVSPRWVLIIISYFMVLFSFFTKKKPLLTPELVLLLEDAPDVSYPEKRKAELELGYQSQSLDVMVKDCFNWLQKEGRI